MFCNIFLFLPNVFPQKHYVYGVVWASGWQIHSGNVGNKWQRIQEIYKPKAVRA